MKCTYHNFITMRGEIVEYHPIHPEYYKYFIECTLIAFELHPDWKEILITREGWYDYEVRVETKKLLDNEVTLIMRKRFNKRPQAIIIAQAVMNVIYDIQYTGYNI